MTVPNDEDAPNVCLTHQEEQASATDRWTQFIQHCESRGLIEYTGKASDCCRLPYAVYEYGEWKSEQNTSQAKFIDALSDFHDNGGYNPDCEPFIFHGTSTRESV